MEDKKEVPKSPADWLSLPMELWIRHIFPHLEYADLLRLRRACGPFEEPCQKIKVYSDDFIRNNDNFKSQVREVNETNYPFKHFLKADLPTNSIFLNNSSPAFFKDSDIPEFLRLYGSQITHVRIRHFGTFISPLELHFFANLPNLLHLDLDFIDAKSRDCMSTIKNAKGIKVRREKPPFPQNFKNLKTLKLNRIQGSKWNDQGYAWDFLEFCEQLEYFKHPCFEGEGTDIDESVPFASVMNYITRRHLKNPTEANLQFYDLEHQNPASEEDEDVVLNEFGWLLALCSERKVKLLNVSSDNFLRHMNMWPRSIKSAYALQLVSLRNVDGFHFLVELPNLEKLVVDDTLNSSYADTWTIDDDDSDEDLDEGHQPGGDVPKWPNLKILDLTINSRTMAGDRSTTQDFLEFLFAPGKKREKVDELAIRYFPDASLRFFVREVIPVPRVKNVTDACPFVTRLTLTSWMGTNRQVTLFWKGLPLLEEVELENCEDLGNVAFVGKEREDPVFLKLKHLKKVSLKGLDAMPKVTDLVFDLVFRHLKIKRFCLTCEMPLKSVTVAGIESLLNGEFNNSVEKFPFDGWSLDGVSNEAFLELKQKFRATHMI